MSSKPNGQNNKSIPYRPSLSSNAFRLSPYPKRTSNKAASAHSRLLASKAKDDEDTESDSDLCVGIMLD